VKTIRSAPILILSQWQRSVPRRTDPVTFPVSGLGYLSLSSAKSNVHSRSGR
jgi:hypothetical protein